VRFIHVTDTHIAADPAFENYGHRPLANLAALVDAINALTFPVDFVLHTGDVAQDRSEAAYVAARAVLARLRLPVYYVAGNHDDAAVLERTMLGREPRGPRLDYTFSCAGVQVAVFDTRGPRDPGGKLQEDQLAALGKLCTPGGEPLVIALHHPPITLDTPWLDNGWPVEDRQIPSMLLENGAVFQDAIAPAAGRIRGVFFGHVHRAFQVMHRGILYASAGSSFGQLVAWPDSDQPVPTPAEPGSFAVVTVTPETTLVSQHTFPRP
jgi:3',5'-cyclic-AMP phosphodiesterase